MELDETQLKYMQIFMPEHLTKTLAVAQENHRFVYYTSAETAMKVIRNSELWLRNAAVMNDFSEVSYGLDLIHRALSGAAGARLREAVDDIHPETIEKVAGFLDGWRHDWELETYIACVSVHKTDEDQRGRLSMWRAYGDTALVVKNTPMLSVTDDLGVYSAPVSYLSSNDFENRLNKVTDCILINRTYLKALGQEKLVSYLHNFFFLTAVATKHPGFSEEEEWRIFYRPNERSSDVLVEHQVVLGGVPQTIFALPLQDYPEQGLHGADIPSLLDRVIIGPTDYPYVSKRAFKRVLSELHGIDDDRVIVSDIPIRVG